MFKKLALCVFIVLCVALFFYPVLLKGYIPFPGDLLVSEFKPWRTYSYNGYVPGSVPNKAQYPDTIRQLYPWRMVVVDSLKKFTLPLWNPYNFSGSPLLANFQSASLYPLNFIFLLFSSPVGWTILIILQPTLAIVFTYIYARKIGLSPMAAVFSGITYGFSSFMTVWLEYNTIGHVILWLPLLLLAVENMREKRSLIWSIIFVVASTVALFGGHPQLYFYLITFVLLYTVVRLQRRSQKIYILLLCLISLGIGAIQLVPGIELILNSARSAHPFDTLFRKILIQPWQLIMALVPDFFGNPATRNYWPSDTYIGKVTYIGLVPLLFFLAAFRLKKNFFVKFYGIVAVSVITLVTAHPLTRLLYRLPIPLFSSSAPTLMVFAYCFAAAMIGGLGMDAWISEKHSLNKLIRRSLQFFGIFAILWLSIFILPKILHESWAQNLVIAKRPLLYSTFLLATILIPYTVAIVKPKWIKISIFVLICFHVIDLFFFFKKFTPFAPTDFLFPKNELFSFLQEKGGVARFWGHSNAHIEANVNAVDRLYSPEGYDPLYPRWYGEFIQSSKDGNIITAFTDQTRSDAAIAPSTGNDDIGLNTSRLRVLDALGVYYVLDRDENASTQIGFPTNRYQLIYQKNAWKVYANLKSAPRFFLTTDYGVYQSPGMFSKLFFDRSFDPATKVLLTENPGFASSPRGREATSILQSYTPDDIRILTSAKQKNLLFLSDTYYPGWQAFIDGKPTKIYKADYAFRAVIVPPGVHVIRFAYRPLSLEIGIIISGVSLGVGIGSALYIKKYNRHE